MAISAKPKFSKEKPTAKFVKKPQTSSTKFEKPTGSKFQNKNNKFRNETTTKNNKTAATTTTTTNEKKNWNQFKKNKKELKLKRKQGKDLYELTARGKQIYEKLKCKSTPNKDVLVKELHSLLRGDTNYQKLVLAHDTARIVQCLLKYSTGDIRREISEGLIPIIVQMSISKYSHFCVMRMVKYGTPDIREKIIQATYGNIVKMVSHAFSSAIVDTIYVSWASSQQKSSMRQELYGDLYKNSKDSSVKCIADTYKHSSEMKNAILNSIKANLNHVVNKKLIDNSLIHSVLLDFLKECSDEDRTEIVTAFSPYIPSLASTKDGVRASIICFWNSIVKDRRAIVKNLKEHLIKLCTHEHGYVLILAIINSMDDTKALKKSIFDPMFGQIKSIVSNEWGRKIIEWFVSPEDTSLFHPQIIGFLEDGLKFSKKDKATRRSELFSTVEDPLCQSIIDDTSFWLRGGHTGLTLAAVLRKYKNSKLSEIYDKLAEVICQPEWKVNVKEIEEKTEEELAMIEVQKKINKKYTAKDDEEKVEQKMEVNVEKPNETILGVEHAGLHIVLKKILKLDQERIKENLPTLSGSMAKILSKETIQIWLALNRPSFLLLNAIENGDETARQMLTKNIKKHLAFLKKQKHAAAPLILKKL